MKRYSTFSKAIFISLLLFLNAKVFSQFRQIHLDKDEDVTLRKTDFYSASEGYIAFSKSLGFSSDSGKTIIDKPIGMSNVNFNGYGVNLTFGFTLSGVKTFDKNRLLIYGHYGLVPAILYSGDGANSFKVVFHSQFLQIPDSYITDLAFDPNNRVGFALEKHRILKTIDGGNTWTVCLTKENTLSKLKVFNESTIYAYNPGSLSKLRFSSIDGGNTWENVFYNYPDGGNDVTACQFFFNEKKIWLNTTSGKLLTSEDGGKSWLLQNDAKNSPINFSAMNVINDTTAYAISKIGFETYKTSNKGKIWEKLRRDNYFSYLNYGLEDIQVLNSNIWVGGGHGYLALSNNLGGTPVPSALFSITENISEPTSTVKITLKSYGRGGYNYQWYVNGNKISDSFDALYTADLYGYNDTIKLVVNNSLYADTLTKITSFSRAVRVTSFIPSTAATGQTINIYGENFNNVTAVYLGGVLTKFSNDNGVLRATVAKGASGNVKVSTAKSTSSKPGFIYIPPPKIISFSPENAKIGDTVVIKGEGLDIISEIWFNNIVAAFNRVSESELTAIVPSSKNTNGSIIVKSFSGSDTISEFKLQPQVNSLNTTKGRYNSTLYIYGSGLYDVESITLDGHPVLTFKYTTSDYSQKDGVFLNVQLGEGGANGELLVKLKNGLSAKYLGFEYYQIPEINDFVPALAKPGEQVLINGNNFRQKTEENFVYFGTVRAIVNSATKTSLSVIVPTGASYSPVTVVNPFTTSASVKYFTPIFEISFKINANTFGSLHSTWMGNNPNALSICDFNGDGKPDISVTEYGSAGAINYFNVNNNILENIRAGKSLKFSRNINDLNNGSIYSTVVDWNHDGVLDVVLAGVEVNSSHREMVTYIKTNYFKTPLSIFNSEVVTSNYSASFFYDSRYIPTGIVATDMNADGQTDILMSGNYGLNSFPNICLGDLDGDGKADVLVKNSDSLYIYRNISTKNFISYAPKKSFYIGATIKKLTVADFDNDKKLDIALAVSNSSGLQIWKNTSEGDNIFIVKSLSIPINDTPTSLAVSDINGDGKIDLAIGHDKGKVLVYQNNTTNNIDFLPSISFNILALSDLALVDIDGDTRPDIIGLSDNTGDSGLQIMRNTVGTSKISSFYPTGGTSGTIIEIKGENFSKTRKLSIGGAEVASFQIKSDTTITAVVGTGNYGFISLEADNGIGSSISKFNFLYKPQIAIQNLLSQAYTIKPGDSVSLNMYNYKADAFKDPLLKIQWFKDGKAIPNATKNSYITKERGNYTVQTSYGNSISEVSNIYQLRVLLSLNQNNFEVSVNNVACKGLSTGGINIKAKENLDYTVNLIGSINRTQNFTSETILENLPTGIYKLRITIKDHLEYEQLFEVNITEPKDFVVFSTVNPKEKTVNFKLTGSDIYYISINGNNYNVSGDINLSLSEELNEISISTDKTCQGTFKEIVNLGDYPIIYPNPVKDILKVNMTNFRAKEIRYKITALNGAIILSNIKQIDNNPLMEIDMTYVPKGIYLLSLATNNYESIYKIVKE